MTAKDPDTRPEAREEPSPDAAETSVETHSPEPAAHDETAIEARTGGQAAVEEPISDEPAVEEPAVEEPAVEEPISDEPAVDEPAVEEPTSAFAALGLPERLLRALDEVGYEDPSPIQAGTIPPLLAGRDVLGQAQTGTGKTAAFALPILSRLRFETGPPQALVLTPTRELAIQVAEAFQRYAAHSRGFRVVPIYGGQGYDGQLRQLRRGVHVVVGTPGRVMDHMRRGTLDLSQLTTLVLDEADEMLRMGFREDVEWILEKTPGERQVALFSATLAPEIRRIAGQHLDRPEEVRTEAGAAPAETIRQRFWVTRGVHKLDALTRLLEVEPFEGMIVFVRTKTATLALAEKLAARGFSAAPINGDMAQNLRERTVQRMESAQVDILVATDVAARGLDIDRVSHVINFDIPYDTDSYVHRVGRTGRAGRRGEAILFVAPRERRMLHAIERATGARIERMEMPSVEAVNDSRVARFEARLQETLEAGEWKDFHALLERFQARHDSPGLEIAAALAKMLQGDQPFLLEDRPEPRGRDFGGRDSGGRDFGGRDFGGRSFDDRDSHDRGRRDRGRSSGPGRDESFERYRVAVGRVHGAGPGDLVGAIAGETGIEGRRIGRIDIHDDHSFVDLPAGMPPDIRDHLQTVRVRGQALAIAPAGQPATSRPSSSRPSPSRPSSHRPGPDRGRFERSRPSRPARDGYDGRDGSKARGGRGRPAPAADSRPSAPGARSSGPGGRAPFPGSRPAGSAPRKRPAGGAPPRRPTTGGPGEPGAGSRGAGSPGAASTEAASTGAGSPGAGAAREAGGQGAGSEKPSAAAGGPSTPGPRFQPPSTRRSGKKARWSKARKRAAKKK